MDFGKMFKHQLQNIVRFKPEQEEVSNPFQDLMKTILPLNQTKPEAKQAKQQVPITTVVKEDVAQNLWGFEDEEDEKQGDESIPNDGWDVEIEHINEPQTCIKPTELQKQINEQVKSTNEPIIDKQANQIINPIPEKAKLGQIILQEPHQAQDSKQTPVDKQNFLSMFKINKSSKVDQQQTKSDQLREHDTILSMNIQIFQMQEILALQKQQEMQRLDIYKIEVENALQEQRDQLGLTLIEVKEEQIALQKSIIEQRMLLKINDLVHESSDLQKIFEDTIKQNISQYDVLLRQNDELESLKVHIQNDKKGLMAKDEEIQDLYQELEKTQEQLEKQIIEKESLYQNFRLKEDQFLDIQEQFKTEQQNSQLNVATLQQEIQSISDNLKQKIHEMSTLTKTQEQKIIQLQDENVQLNHENKSWTEQIVTYLSNLKDKDKEIEDLQHKISINKEQVDQQIRKNNEFNHSATQNISLKDQEIVVLKKQIQLVQKQVEDNIVEINSLKNTTTQNQHSQNLEIFDLKQQLNLIQGQAQIDLFKNQPSSLQTIASQNDNITKLNEEIKSLRVIIQNDKQVNLAKDEEIQDLYQELEKTQEQLEKQFIEKEASNTIQQTMDIQLERPQLTNNTNNENVDQWGLQINKLKNSLTQNLNLNQQKTEVLIDQQNDQDPEDVWGCDIEFEEQQQDQVELAQQINDQNHQVVDQIQPDSKDISYNEESDPYEQLLEHKSSSNEGEQQNYLDQFESQQPKSDLEQPKIDPYFLDQRVQEHQSHINASEEEIKDQQTGVLNFFSTQGQGLSQQNIEITYEQQNDFEQEDVWGCDIEFDDQLQEQVEQYQQFSSKEQVIDQIQPYTELMELDQKSEQYEQLAEDLKLQSENQQQIYEKFENQDEHNQLLEMNQGETIQEELHGDFGEFKQDSNPKNHISSQDKIIGEQFTKQYSWTNELNISPINLNQPEYLNQQDSKNDCVSLNIISEQQINEVDYYQNMRNQVEGENKIQGQQESDVQSQLLETNQCVEQIDSDLDGWDVDSACNQVQEEVNIEEPLMIDTEQGDQIIQMENNIDDTANITQQESNDQQNQQQFQQLIEQPSLNQQGQEDYQRMEQSEQIMDESIDEDQEGAMKLQTQLRVTQTLPHPINISVRSYQENCNIQEQSSCDVQDEPLNQIIESDKLIEKELTLPASIDQPIDDQQALIQSDQYDGQEENFINNNSNIMIEEECIGDDQKGEQDQLIQDNEPIQNELSTSPSRKQPIDLSQEVIMIESNPHQIKQVFPTQSPTRSMKQFSFEQQNVDLIGTKLEDEVIPCPSQSDKDIYIEIQNGSDDSFQNTQEGDQFTAQVYDDFKIFFINVVSKQNENINVTWDDEQKEEELVLEDDGWDIDDDQENKINIVLNKQDIVIKRLMTKFTTDQLQDFDILTVYANYIV